MKKSVAATVRMHKWRLEERTRVVDELERLREKLIAASTQLESELGDPGRGRPALANQGYAQAVGQRRERIAKSLADVEAQMDQARKDVAEAFDELKKYEAALANRERMRQKRGRPAAAKAAEKTPVVVPVEPQRRVG
jgi:chromosome segregation ATPase